MKKHENGSHTSKGLLSRLHRFQNEASDATDSQNSVRLGIMPKLLAGIMIPAVVILLITGILLVNQASTQVEGLMKNELTARTQAASETVNSYFMPYFGLANGLASSNSMIDLQKSSSRESLLSSPLYPTVFKEMLNAQKKYNENVAVVWICDFSTGELTQSDKATMSPPDYDYTTRAWYPSVSAEQKTIITTPYEDSFTGETIVSIVSPVFSGSKMVGVVGIDVQMTTLIEDLNQLKIGETGYIMLLASDDAIIYHPDDSLITTSASDVDFSQNMSDALRNNDNVDGILYTRDGNSYYGSTEYIEALQYQLVGILPQAEFDGEITSTIIGIVILFVIAAILMGAISVILAFSITRPVKRLCSVAEKLADGELDVEYEVTGSDEVSMLGNHILHLTDRLREYIGYVTEVSQVLKQMGEGNLIFTLKHDYVGEFAQLKSAMIQIQTNLSNTLMSIAQAAQQVDAGSEQISSGAQALAQGATEQASSIQDLSNTVQDLSDQATTGAEHAVEVSRRLEQIKGEVDESNAQMKAMLDAMDEITRQSNAIGNIIKTIEDIAFQTNILALNAAVEAARAGEAGKGFAVVADEVRNLAGKSTDSAKETNDLITNSIAAVKRGEEIAKATAEVLEQATQGTAEVVKKIELVSETYQAQALRLGEVSTGVDQISSVVQTNSATAEESAAASEELASQVTEMQNQIAQFKLSEEFDQRNQFAQAEQGIPSMPRPIDSDHNKY